MPSSSNTRLPRGVLSAGALAAAVTMTGCASYGLPGSGETTNKEFFRDDADMMDRVNRLTHTIKSGQSLPMPAVLAVLNRKRLELNTMNRTAIRGALEGTGPSPVPLVHSALTEDKLACKEGLSFQFTSKDSKYTLDNPVKWTQTTRGFAYKVEMIFNSCSGPEPVLETVILEGGPIRTQTKRTIFDLLKHRFGD